MTAITVQSQLPIKPNDDNKTSDNFSLAVDGEKKSLRETNPTLPALTIQTTHNSKVTVIREDLAGDVEIKTWGNFDDNNKTIITDYMGSGDRMYNLKNDREYSLIFNAKAYVEGANESNGVDIITNFDVSKNELEIQVSTVEEKEQITVVQDKGEGKDAIIIYGSADNPSAIYIKDTLASEIEKIMTVTVGH